MAASLDLVEQPLNDVAGPDRRPVLLGIGVEGQTRFQVALQALHGRRIDRLEPGAERRHFLVGCFTVLLVKNGPQFRPNTLLLALGHIAQDVLDLVLDAALPVRVWKATADRIEHGLMTIADPQVELLHAASLEVVQQVFPGGLVLSLADRKAQYLSFSG